MALPKLVLLRDEDTIPYDGEMAPKRAAGFAMIPAEVYALKDGTALAVYAVLAQHADRDGVCWPSMKRLEELLGWSDNRIRPALKKLVDAGLVAIEHRQFRGMDQANRYRLQPNVQVSRDGTAVSRDGAMGIPPRESRYPATGYEQEPIEQEPKEQEIKTPLPPKADEQFETEFWPRYPKGRGSKKDALGLWRKLGAEDRAAALAALPAFAAGSDWQRGYHAAPEVWLRGRRWENPPLPAAAVPSANGHRPTVSEQNAMVRAKLLAEAEAAQHGGEVIDVYAEVRR